MVKNSVIEKTNDVVTHCPTTYVTENKEENHLEIYIFKVSCALSTSFKHPKLPISIKIPVTLLQIVYICMTSISPHSSS